MGRRFPPKNLTIVLLAAVLAAVSFVPEMDIWRVNGEWNWRAIAIGLTLLALAGIAVAASARASRQRRER